MSLQRTWPKSFDPAFAIGSLTRLSSPGCFAVFWNRVFWLPLLSLGAELLPAIELRGLRAERNGAGALCGHHLQPDFGGESQGRKGERKRGRGRGRLVCILLN